MRTGSKTSNTLRSLSLRFSASILDNKRPIRSYSISCPHLWISPDDVEILLAWDNDIGRMGYKQPIHFNTDHFETLREALCEHNFKDEWSKDQKGVSFHAATVSTTLETVLSSTPVDRYNEVVVRFKEEVKALACIYVDPSDPDDFKLDQYIKAMDMKDELKLPESILVLNTITNELDATLTDKLVDMYSGYLDEVSNIVDVISPVVDTFTPEEGQVWSERMDRHKFQPNIVKFWTAVLNDDNDTSQRTLRGKFLAAFKRAESHATSTGGRS